MGENSNKKSASVIIALAVAILLGVVVLVVACASLVNSGGDKKEESKYVLTKPQGTAASTEDVFADFSNGEADNNNGIGGNNAENVISGNADNGVGNNQQSVNGSANGTMKDAWETDPIKYYESLEKTGDNILSDHHDNKYIKTISQKYNIDPEMLVAIYSKPDKGSNFVIQFKDTRDEDGNIIKSPDTMEKLYMIDKEGNVSIATGKPTGNVGVSYAEGTLSFYMIQVLVMPQYPDYFEGVEEKK